MRAKKAPPPRDSFADALREAESYKNLTLEEKGAALFAACAFAFAQLENNPRRDEVLAYRAPLPEPTVRILAKLKKAYAAR